MSTLRLLVSGDRRFQDTPTVADGLALGAALLTSRDPHGDIVLVHGGAGGLDSLASARAAELGWNQESHPAQWSVHTAACPPHHAGQPTCKIAGHRRNAEMLQPRPDLLVAFPLHKRDLAPGEDRRLTSRGTWSMVALALAASVPTAVIWRGCAHPADPVSAMMLAAHVAPSGEPAWPQQNGAVPLHEALMPF